MSQGAARREAVELTTAELTDAERGGVYRLLGRMLATAPSEMDLRLVAGLTGDTTPFGEVVDRLAATAGISSAEDVSDQFFRLFIGLGSGELAPYASVYISGSMHDAPLVALRHDMRKMGLKRAPDVSEPEDHIAFVMEIMAGLVDGEFSAAEDDAARFFRAHVAPWASRFFDDLAHVEGTPLFAATGELGQKFMAMERARFGGASSPG